MNLKTRRFLHICLISVVWSAMVMLLDGCSAIKKAEDIEVTSVNLKSFSPVGLKGVDAVLSIGVANPTIGFTLSDIEGCIKYNGEEFATYSGGPIAIAGKTSDEYDLPCSLHLSPAFSLFTALKIAASGNLEGLTTDVQAKVTLKGGIHKTLKYVDMPIEDLMDDSEE